MTSTDHTFSINSNSVQHNSLLIKQTASFTMQPQVTASNKAIIRYFYKIYSHKITKR